MRHSFALVLSLVIPTIASAQPVATSFEELGRHLRPGTTLTVTDDTGRQTKGTLGELTPSSLVLLVGRDAQRVILPQANVVRVTRQGSRALGTLIGFGAGALAGFLFGEATGTHEDCEGWGLDACSLVGLLGGAGIGAAAGALASGGTRTLYQARSRAPALALTPRLSTRTAGLAVSMRF
jgi:hypothetical protein